MGVHKFSEDAVQAIAQVTDCLPDLFDIICRNCQKSCHIAWQIEDREVFIVCEQCNIREDC